MDLKRKRSDSDLPSASPTPSPSFGAARHIHPGGRTLKRFRDSRPSSDEIHQNTLNRLYAAQLRAPSPPNQTEMAVDEVAPPAPACVEEVDRSQTSLDRFFTRMPQPQSQPTQQQAQQQAQQQSTQPAQQSTQANGGWVQEEVAAC